MCTRTKVLLAALLAASFLQAAEIPPSSMAGSAPVPLTPLPPGWSLMGYGGQQALPGSCELGIDSQQSIEDRSPYSIRCRSTVLPSFGGATKTLNVAPYRGKRVRVSSLVMASGIERVDHARYPDARAEAGLWIGVGTPRDGMMANTMPGRRLSGTTGWEQRDFVVDIPADANQFTAGFWMQGKGQFWVQELVVEEVPTTVPVNFERNAPQPDAAPDMTLASTAVPRANDRFLPPPPKWFASGGTGFELCDIGVDAQLLKQGQQHLAIACSVAVSASLSQYFEATLFWTKRVRFSAMVRTENVEPPPVAIGPGGALLLLGNLGTQSQSLNTSMTGTSDWTYREVVMDVPRNVEWLSVGLAVNGRGKVWARDFKFEVVPMDAAVTSVPVRP